MNATHVLAALVVGIATGFVFAGLRVPLPAPPSLPGIVGIVGIYVGYRIVEATGVGFDLLSWLGLG
ncbi:XapX domain-containing protein [Halarchaeum nitratireducens]|nr:XapX domain-containing protein [Halarchaeum nitratireducens]